MAESKVAFDGPRRNTFLLAPESPSIVIVGLDTQDGDSHPLYDTRIHKPLREATVIDILLNGVIEPVIVTKGRKCAPLLSGEAVPAEAALVVDGRGRVMHAREANRRLLAAGSVPIRVPVLSPMRGSDSELLGRLVALNEHRQEDSALGKARKIDEAEAKRLLGFKEAEPEVESETAAE